MSSRVLSIGIVGLPNVGKSTLFNALLKKQVADVANYPFCTIEPNVGVIEVPDERLPVLAKIVAKNPSTPLRLNSGQALRTAVIPPVIPAVVEFYDIAGLVKGASKGEGLGNKFLSHIREVAAIVHVVRLFEDSNVAHVSDKINPVEDIQTIENELMLADLETLSKQKEPKGDASKEVTTTYRYVVAIKEKLNQGIAARNQNLDEEAVELIKPLNLLTLKPVIYVFNVSEQQLQNPNSIREKIRSIISQSQLESVKSVQTDSTDSTDYNRLNYLYLCAKLENEVLAFSEQEQKEFLQQYQLEETGLNRLIKKAYETLGLISFLTAGEKEVRAWTITKGTLAPQAAGVIHTDFEKHFIKAEVIPYPEFVDAGGWIKAREKGLVQTVGKDYMMREGEVVEFKVGI